MNLKEKIEAEQQDRPLIILYMEGMFWKAYEQSAMRFTKEVKAYRLQKRFVKIVNGEVVSMGFPDGSLQEVLNGRELTRIDDKRISFYVETAFSAAEFEAWKAELPLDVPGVTPATGVVPAAVSETVLAAQPDTRFSEAERCVLARLAAFRVETASPLQCMMLVSDLQALLKQ
ncbi:hypothetical protein [uncultured Parabacteroides sp.]|uniref:hypothetical protein n=1 Tax=uncultured Parabacteroides sp. TaxID=512312 RepID=UPI0025DEFE5A|nr:hypothetical protein [uncultured Parabacteroides sp.]